MLEEENLVTEEVAENVEGTTEQTEGQVEQVTTEPVEETFTKAQVDEMIAKKLARKEAKIRKDFEKKYGRAENIVKAGLGVDSFEEGVNQLEDFYKKKGVDIPNLSAYNDYDMQAGAEKEANEIIESGFEEVVEEVERLADIGFNNMTPREKAMFQKLADYRKTTETHRELAKMGVKEDVYASKEFKDFASKFNSNTPVVDIYNIYAQTQPKPKVETMGSMKNTVNNDSGVKDFYTRDEALKFTKKDFDKNPALFKAVEKSMLRW